MFLTLPLYQLALILDRFLSGLDLHQEHSVSQNQSLLYQSSDLGMAIPLHPLALIEFLFVNLAGVFSAQLNQAFLG